MKKIFKLLLLLSFQIVFAQNDYFEKGNSLLQNGKYEEAQKIFENGLKENPKDLMYKNQIALALINQGKNNDAEETIKEVLKVDSLNVAALWYGGINNFMAKEGDFKKAIIYFEKAYPLINKNSGQFFGVNFYIGKSYRNLLYSEGLSFEETDRMLETLEKYTELQPDAEDYQDTIKFVNYIKEKRPPKNVKKWVIANSEKKAEEIIKNELK
ncbi:tetratricopeptide repeat protein [Epilithonimonas zeae]|uniref:Tetratricopeptide repeat-containing protein n=1 Tax=Epilithonimonas zeae TaxID=1416779 RepID=A0A1N6FHR3_9FLAO|nr:tetratricopeptide repeat protein [Epilithonimonas zeae]SIN94770.1 Tetratricopeptide repeat-containing protein [Epilithonimonas zeae]